MYNYLVDVPLLFETKLFAQSQLCFMYVHGVDHSRIMYYREVIKKYTNFLCVLTVTHRVKLATFDDYESGDLIV